MHKTRRFATLSLLAIPTIPLLSCGATNTAEVDNSYFIIANPYKANSKSARAVEDIVRSYNKFIEQENEQLAPEKRWKPARLVTLANSYESTFTKIALLLQNNVINDLPSLTWGEPSAITLAARYNRALELDVLPKSAILPGFRRLQVQGVDDNHQYAVQTGSSTTVNSVNLPILGYVVREFLKKGAHIADDSQEQAFFKNAQKVATHDEAAVVARYGKITDDPAVLKRIRSYVFNRKSLDNLMGLLELVGLIKAAFPSLRDAVAGIDDPVYLLHVIVYSAFGLDNEKTPFRLESRKSQDGVLSQQLTYKEAFTPGNKAYNILQTYFNAVKPYIMDGSLWISTRDNVFGSTFFKEHRMLFSLTSTSGWEYLSVKQDKFSLQDDSRNLLTARHFLFEDVAAHLPTLRLLGLHNIDTWIGATKQAHQVGYYVDFQDKNIYRVWAGSGKDGLEVPPSVPVASHDIVLPADVAKRLTDSMDKRLDNNHADDYVVLDKSTHPAFKLSTAHDVSSEFKYRLGDRVYDSSAMGLFTTVALYGTENTTQPSEVAAISSVHRLDPSIPYRAYYIRGPIMLGFQTSAERDKNARHFAEYYATANVWDLVDKNGDATKVSGVPMKLFANAGSYILNTASGILSQSTDDSMKDNALFASALPEVEQAASGRDPHSGLYRMPASVLSPELRRALYEGLSHLNEPNYTFENFVSDVLRTVESLNKF